MKMSSSNVVIFFNVTKFADDHLRILHEMGMHQTACIEYMERQDGEQDVRLTHYRHVQSS